MNVDKKDQWKGFASSSVDKKIDVEELVQWACKLRPRSVHDFKPLLILMQGLLKDFLHGKLDLFNIDVQELVSLTLEREAKSASKLKEMAETMAEMHARLESIDWEKLVRNPYPTNHLFPFVNTLSLDLVHFRHAHPLDVLLFCKTQHLDVLHFCHLASGVRKTHIPAFHRLP